MPSSTSAAPPEAAGRPARGRQRRRHRGQSGRGGRLEHVAGPDRAGRPAGPATRARSRRCCRRRGRRSRRPAPTAPGRHPDGGEQAAQPCRRRRPSRRRPARRWRASRPRLPRRTSRTDARGRASRADRPGRPRRALEADRTGRRPTWASSVGRGGDQRLDRRPVEQVGRVLDADVEAVAVAAPWSRRTPSSGRTWRHPGRRGGCGVEPEQRGRRVGAGRRGPPSPGTAGCGPASARGATASTTRSNGRSWCSNAARSAARTRATSSAKAGSPDEVGAHGQRVDEEADQVVERVVGAPGDGRAEHDVVAGPEPVQQGGHRRPAASMNTLRPGDAAASSRAAR